jgi:transcriptional regulator with XRE-family HTH domain
MRTYCAARMDAAVDGVIVGTFSIDTAEDSTSEGRITSSPRGQTRRNLLNPVEEVLRLRVREERIRAGFTQSQLAERVAVATETVSRLERGTSMPSLRAIVKIAEVLRVDLGYLLHARRDPTPHEQAVDRLRWTLRERSVADVELVIDLATRIFAQGERVAPEGKRVKRSP